jgi:hypothetical protein
VGFDSPDLSLNGLLADIGVGKIQLPDFQREWKWDDDRIRSLLGSIARGHPVGVLMMLQVDSDATRFAPKPVAGVTSGHLLPPDRLILDGQQRLTSLYQALAGQGPVDTSDPRGKKLQRWYYVDIQAVVADNADIEEAILSIPADKVIRDDFGRTVVADYSSLDGECLAEVFPLAQAFHMPAVFAWQNRYLQIDPDEAGSRAERWNKFYSRVLDNFVQYTVPTIVLNKDTPKDAVCTVFEKVNTGGVPLNVFELLTASFAADNFRLKVDWQERRDILAKKAALREVQNTDFLQAVALMTTRERRLAFVAAGRDGTPPGIGCKRKDILDLTVADYQRWAPDLVDAFSWAGEFLNEESIFIARDVPYRTQLVPLAVIRAALGGKAAFYGVRERIRQWFWCGVLGELYGGSIETRFARDLEQVPDWASDASNPTPLTVSDASFREQRLQTLRTRNSAAYKGIYALLMSTGARDWLKSEQIGLANFHDYQVDIHHIFPKAWCAKNHIDEARQESIVNKTAIARHTNIVIGGRAPSKYLLSLAADADVTSEFLDGVVETHAIRPDRLRSDDFDGFFDDRKERLLTMISDAMGKPAIRDVATSGEETYEEEPADEDLVEDELSA